jgi:hypothetical protein
MVIAQQQREVGGRTGSRERHRPHSEVLDALQTCGVSVGVGRQHHLGATAQHLRAHPVGIADDERGTVPRLAQDVRARPDADQHGLVLLDERFERLEIVGGVRFLRDDDHVAAVEVDVDVRDADAVDEQRALAADEFDGVARECLEVRDQPALGLVHQLVDLVVGAFGARDQASVTGVDTAVVQPHPVAVLDLLEDLRAGFVDQRDAVRHQHLRPEIGVAPGDGRGRVDHTCHPGLDQGVGGDPVEIERVDDHDVTGADTPQQAIDVAVHASGAGDSRP